MAIGGGNTLDLVIRARNEASREFENVKSSLEGVQGRLESMQPQFKRMATVGGAAFGAVSGAVGISVKAAADAEVAWSAMDTTFGDASDTMREFISDVRSDLPKAEREIAKKTTVLGGMARGMGFTEQESAKLTQQIIEAAAAQAAFRGEDPSETLRSMMAMMSGSTEAARRYGINIRQGAVEQKAMEMGLVDSTEAINNLDEATKEQILTQARLQAITEGSVAAFDSLEKEKETVAFQMRQLKANTEDIREVFGEQFLPMVNEAVQRISPLVERIGNWIEENPELARTITIVALAVTGLITGVGILGLVLPKIIAGFKLMAAGALILKKAVIGLTLAKAALLLPILAVIAILWVLIFHFDKVVEAVNRVSDWVYARFLRIRNIIRSVIQSVVRIFRTGWQSAGRLIQRAINFMIRQINRVLNPIRRVRDGINSILGGGVRERVSGAVNRLRGAIGVNDALITSSGQVIKFHPDDNILAMKDFGNLAPQTAGGGTTVLNVTVNNQGSVIAENDLIDTIEQGLTNKLRRKR